VFLELNLDSSAEPDFPSLMSLYCKSVKNGRQQLLQKIRKQFDYIEQFEELYGQATKFHEELSSIYFIKTIFTTNWDDYFERICAAIPIVTSKDFAFHGLPGRKVYKLHGSIGNYGSIIASDEDYERCYKDLSEDLMGAQLKLMLSTKTLLFIGYSLRDFDFLRIHGYLRKLLGDVFPHAYLVSPEAIPVEDEKITQIQTSGDYFLKGLREHLEGTEYLFPKDKIEFICFLKNMLTVIHGKLTAHKVKSETLNLVYCAQYQDGFIHALQYLIFNSRCGKSLYPPHIVGTIETYDKILRKQNLKAKRFGDVAYIDGYVIGMQMMFVEEKFDEIPFWYIFGYGPTADKKFFEKCIEEGKIFHKGADLYAKKHYKFVIEKGSEIVFHHIPFLNSIDLKLGK
jgi:hypothetical protein